MTYTETVTSNGETATGVISDFDALTTLRRGIRLGATVAAAKDGTITIVRTYLHLNGETISERKIVVTLRPDAKQQRLTQVQHDDLTRIRTAGARAKLLDTGRVTGMFCQIPPSAAKRLFDRGFAIVTNPEGRVEVTIAGLLAMAAFEHQTRTVGGSETVSGGGHVHFVTGEWVEATGYFVSAYCSCHDLKWCDTDRDAAQGAAKRHLAEKLSAALVAA